MTRHAILRLVTAALCLALGILLPIVFHAIGGAGAVFLPMHIPVLLCGLLCGPRLGALCGLATPLLSSAFTGMPPLYPIAVAMMLELAAYGLAAGLLKKRFQVHPSLVGAMLAGRIVLGVANTLLLGFGGKPYSLEAFLAASFVTALPGIAIQLVLVPILYLALEKAGFVRRLQPAA